MGRFVRNGSQSLLFAFLGVFLFVWVGCQKTIVLDIGYVQEDIPEHPLILPSDGSDTLYKGLHSPAAVMEFYKQTGQHPGWVDNEQTNVLGDSLVLSIKDIRYSGLLPQNYHMQILTAENRLSWRPEWLLRRDVLLTDAFITLFKDLSYGRLSLQDSAADSVAVARLSTALRENKLSVNLRAMEPRTAQYAGLKSGLKGLLESMDSIQRQRLLNGATPDSTGLEREIRAVEINLDRWRWEREVWSERYIFVNIPSFMVRVIDRGEVALESRAIVGKPQNATPTFSSMVQCFVTYPYWRVPRKISIEELLPAIQRDTSFIRRNNFDVLDRRGNLLNPDSIQWKDFHKNNFPVSLRQREGVENSLGIIKFVFDNPFAVFIHDTNAPRLFRKEKRALSHGCVRMEKAASLGHYLLTGEKGQKSPMLENFLEQKLRHTVDLPQPIPVHIRYFTAEYADEKLMIFEDVYKKDQPLIDRFYTVAPVLSLITTN